MREEENLENHYLEAYFKPYSDFGNLHTGDSPLEPNLGDKAIYTYFLFLSEPPM